MNLQDFKITVILAILFGLFHSSCQMNEFDTSLIFDEPREFQYTNGTLTEKHTFYYGIDPGFSQCNSNLIYKYNY